MKVLLADVVRLDQPSPSAGPAPRREPVFSGRPSRRALMRAGVVGAASVLTLRIAGVVGMPKAYANHSSGTVQGYQIKGDCSDTGGWYNQTPPLENCDRPCGPSTIFGDACDRQQGSHYFGFHKNNGTCFGCFTLRADQCSASYWDGWKWGHKQQCYPCWPFYNTADFRCHDGFKNYGDPPPMPPNPSICSYLVGCRQQ